MTDCIRSLLINCSHLKELSILSNITFHHLSYLKIYGSTEYRKQPKTTEYYRKQPNTTENNRILPKTTEY